MKRAPIATGMMAAALAMASMPSDSIVGGPSRSELELERERRAARKSREAWENAPEGESRQVRRWRERRGIAK